MLYGERCIRLGDKVKTTNNSLMEIYLLLIYINSPSPRKLVFSIRYGEGHRDRRSLLKAHKNFAVKFYVFLPLEQGTQHVG